MDVELIHADSDMRELRQMTFFSRFDAELSLDEADDNSWMLELPEQLWAVEPVLEGHYIYISGTEWGGPVERVSHICADGTVRLYGACWRGLLARRVICPEAGQTHRVVTGTEANAALAELLGQWGGGLFAVSEEDSGLICSASLRYRTLLDSAYALLGDSGRLEITFDEGHALLRCLPVRDLSELIELSQDYDARITSERTSRKYNHIIALGGGEMLERTVIELYALSDGSMTDDPDADGVPDENELSTLLYDYSAVESDDELRRAAVKKLRSAAAADSMEIELYDYDGTLMPGDIVSVRDDVTGMATRMAIRGTVLKITEDGVTVEHSLKAIHS